MGDALSSMKPAAVAVGILAIVVMVTIAVILGFKTTNLVDNTVADSFVTGLTIFATFIGVIVLTIVGKIIIDLVTGS